jgi:transposase
MEQFISDEQWARLAPLLPQRTRNPKGGRPRVDDRACLEGILWVLRTGARWRDLPRAYPSPATCWRRLAEWEAADVWLAIWRAFLAELDAEGLIGWEECFIDGTFAPAKKGELASARHARVRGRSLWYWSSARVYLSECAWRLPRWPRSRSPSGRSPRCASRAGGRAGRGPSRRGLSPIAATTRARSGSG